MYVIYVSNLIRVTLALHDLINNKIRMKDIEADNLKKEKEAEEERQKKKEEIAS
jgi:26S proteasome regulatory subunit N8